MNSMNTSNYLFQASKQASKKLTLGIDESHSGLKILKLSMLIGLIRLVSINGHVLGH